MRSGRYAWTYSLKHCAMNTSSSENVNLQGLGDAQVEASRSQHGENVLTPPRRTSYWKLYLDKYRDPIIQILLVAALVSLLLAFIERDFMETLGIILAVVIATTVGFYFECDAARRFNVLTAMNEDQRVKVRRNGRVTEVKRREVVVGDIILVEVGDEIPADAQLVEAVNLQVDESSLTGEPLTTKSIDATKEGNEPYPPNVILRSTMVMNGRGTAVVTAVGDATEIGKVAQKSTESTSVKTPLNIQLDKLAKLISKIGTIVSVAAFVIFLVHDILTNSIWYGNDYFGMMHIVLNYFMMAVTLIVMAVPEGLPMAVTLALALNMRRMLKSNVLVRKLHASETMGAVTVICTDKTGTLTQNKMRVGHITPANPSDPNSELLLNVAMAVNSTAELDGENVVGNPTEGALLLWLRDHDKHYATLRQQYKVVSQQPFSTEKKYMLTTVDMGDKTMTFVKGAPEMVLDMCAPDAPERQRAEEVLAHYQQQAMRTLAFAYATGDEPFTLQGVVAISDPVRPDVLPAVAECQRAGIQVKVVTGDTSATAIEIARQIGVWPAHGEREEATWHITGDEWASLSDEEAFKRCMALRVMSRARPTDKQRLVEMLQRHGEVVAVTGDGTNDAPALNHAHVGLSLGSGTSVAKQASDITLLDDSFHAIANAVMWGRSLYKNIQRFLFFQLVVNLSALLLVLGGSIIGTEMPLTVTQILWVNLIMDTFAAMALASLPPSHEVMRNKPRRDTDFIISRPMARGILFCGMVFFLGMFMFLIWCERHGAGSVVDVHELTLFFTTFVMLQFWNLLNAKSLGSDYSAFRYFWRDGGLVLVLALVFIGQWIIVTFGGKMFRTLPLSFEEWGAITVGTSVVLWAGELWRGWKRWRNHKFSVLKP